MIDLRSDTITKPTPEMRQAMADAEVGDDVLGDDPTVQALEQRTAEMLGMEAAAFMPSGTMTNQVAIRAHTEPGDEMLCEANSHVYYYEAGAPAALSGVMVRLLTGERGIFTAATLREAIRHENVHYPRPRLVCLENTHNRGGGSIWPLEAVMEVRAVATDAGLRMHLDGARLWNASVATGIPERDYAACFDSVSVCYSKGLGAPVGSALAGSAEFIQRARRFRKMFGGGMRQSGILAAAAMHALDHHRDRLAEDHANAAKLARDLSGRPGVELDPTTVETNIVLFRLTTVPAAILVEKLRDAGVLVLATGPDSIRAVMSLMVSADDIGEAADTIAEAVRSA